MADPEWLRKAIADGSASVKGVNPSAFGPVLDRAPKPDSMKKELWKFAIAGCQSEDDFQDVVADIAHFLGWKVVHVRKVLVTMGKKTHYETPFALDGAGSFDLDFYRERHFKAELKYGRNTPQANQRTWGLVYDSVGIENYIWYPKHYEEIVTVLTRYAPCVSPSAARQ